MSKDRILRRIKKCLALSKSSNEHEAAAALRQAKAMMEKHGITLHDAELPSIEVLDTSAGKHSRARYTIPEKHLINVICSFFGCSVVFSNSHPVIAGEAPAPEICSYAIHVLVRQIQVNRKDSLKEFENQHFKLKPSEAKTFNRSYGIAWVAAVSEKVREFASQITEQIRDAQDQAIRTHFNMDVGGEFREVNKPKIKDSPLETYALGKGWNDGKQANIQSGMSGQQSPVKRLNS